MIANELLEDKNGQWLDREMQEIAIPENTPMETMAKSRGKTSEGKAISKMNAYKHGGRSAEVREVQTPFAKWKRELNRLVNL